MIDTLGTKHKIVEGLVFTVNNRHVAECGTPPAINGNVRGRYYGYFENEHGEQAVFVYDYGTEEGTLFLGDLSWEKPIRVVDGHAPGVIRSNDESTWLLACWTTATTFKEARRRLSQ